ncbi:hypothetical protein ROLI_005380 [Roseobacter fucihabitans]|uniref:Exopolysaccharide synthesis, ExoD n=1 Tax=Roseobacter fucihabitans TaxID=1537242 RepID=A0ABZ2BQF8_9RHOB|nr:exopolysaccharide biosynthesis protein [Roseobacter litoralis]MBC6964711.1 Exopolysaccharide synthesis, ExoD [Roseobacter litoralis]
MTRLLDAVDGAASDEDETVAVREIISEIGSRTVTPVILTVALLLMSPLSAIPGLPTTGAIIIVILCVQALLGRRLSLPRRLMEAELATSKVAHATGWLRRPAKWVDRVSQPRLHLLTRGAMRILVLGLCAVIALWLPALELIPGVTTIGATAIGLFAFGLFARDGYFVIAGFVLLMMIGTGAIFLLNAAAT